MAKRYGRNQKRRAREREHQAAEALADLLSSAMFQAWNDGVNPRLYLYGWERRAFIWLIGLRDQGSAPPLNAWTCSFIDLNRSAILSVNERMNFNLRSARTPFDA
ncbi:hypothetical protein [Labrenzia sp. R5_0]|uniref:hypothetical protein n=1 Tax=Labrenzia sp. R5_0 TaxID=2821108 RepID=UPI001ADCA500|nr:hypothetical protein [Labrenzia sp. R5_0]MBO9458954.1 hypothetical protein [Labrenzia sp. R5_0]